jgi:hypothetical protein
VVMDQVGLMTETGSGYGQCLIVVMDQVGLMTGHGQCLIVGCCSLIR